ncbi:MAG: dolichol kinase [Ignavibacteriales bacterium]|nr:dolichol kinase [Ignavibacteriales bacterium]
MSESPLKVQDAPIRKLPESELLHAKATIEYKSEFIRKLIHLCSLSIPTVYYFISRERALEILAPVFLAFFIVDLARFYHEPTQAWFYRWFGWLLRRHESDSKSKRLTGATNILLSAIVCVMIFPKIITINAFAILIISDITSALVGRRFGKHRFFQKSLEGATGFFVSALVVVLLAPKIERLPMEYVLGIIAAAAGAVTESMSTTIDDNISVPLVIGFVLWTLYTLFLPGINLYAFL